MLSFLTAAVQYFIPANVQEDRSSLMKARIFVALHIMGPFMGQASVLFLWRASTAIGWEFWTLEAVVTAFWTLPLILKWTGSLALPTALSVQMLMFASLFGSFFYGGISSPFLPWLLIALLTGFFYLSERALLVVGSTVAQMGIFVAARLYLGGFPTLLPLNSLTYVNVISVVSAISYVTILSLFYEHVIRAGSELEESMRQHRSQTAALREAFRLTELASKQKSIFLAKMSHELRTPLNAVIGYSEMLRDDLDDAPIHSERAEDLERINAAGRHLLALVTKVLDLSSIEANRMEINAEEVDVEQLIRDVVSTTSQMVAKKDNRLIQHVFIEPGLIIIDPLKLRQALLNLLSNAAKFTSQGFIELNVRTIDLSSGRRLIISIKDTGIGMSEDGLKKLFQEFNQVEKDTAHKFGGTGLGLALTRRFCTLMGGEIRVESKLGQGSCFTIDLPCVYKDSAAAEPTGRLLVA